ncbi:MAG: polysaccharide deacetylase family protein [Candidatus Hydrothermales bacterium]
MFFFLFVISIYLLYKKPTIEMKEYFIKKILVKEKEVRHFYDGSIKRFNTDKKEIYLTFDGGNYAQRAEVILDVLKENNIKASFFLTGEFIKKFPEIVKRIIRDSHEVLNHTYSHPHLTTYEINGRNFTRKDITPEKVFGELFRTEEIYEKLTGRKMDYIWRAPYGEENKEIIRWASRMGYIHIRWSFDFLDWRSVEDYKKRLKEFFKIRDKRGYILLLHLGSPENDTADYRVFLSHLIKELKNQKYEFKKISEGLRKVYY